MRPLLGHAESPCVSINNLALPQPDLPGGSQTSLEPSLSQISAAVNNGAAVCWDHRLEACWWHEAPRLVPLLRHVPRSPRSLPETGAIWHPYCPVLLVSSSQGPEWALGFESWAWLGIATFQLCGFRQITYPLWALTPHLKMRLKIPFYPRPPTCRNWV